MVVAATALVAVDVAHRNSRQLFKIGDDGTEGLAVTRVAVQCLGVQHEVSALGGQACVQPSELFRRQFLTFASSPSIEIKSLEDFRDFLPHSLIQP
jgi:hypothetical protein